MDVELQIKQRGTRVFLLPRVLSTARCCSAHPTNCQTIDLTQVLIF